MATTEPVTVLNCTQCGGELHPDEGQIFLTCPYCSATVYVDRSQVVFHWYLAPTLNENQARGELARWMGGNQTVKDLDKKSTLTSVSFQYFPVWVFKFDLQKREQISLEPGAATSITELRRLRLPAGDLRKYDSDLDSQCQSPNVPLETALGWLHQSKGENVAIKETSLVHIPLFTIKYNFQGQSYTALVEAGTGEVIANIYPAKAEAPYLLAAGITVLVYLFLALIPVVFSLFSSSAISLTGVGICLGLGVVATPFLFAMAVYVSSKV